MQEHKLTRTGNVPLAFAGEQLARESGRWHAGVEQNRWHEITVYKTAAGRVVVAITYRTLWQGETDYHAVEVVDDLRAAAAVLRAYVPAEYLLGYPPALEGTQFALKQARLQRSLEDRYRDAVTAVLDALDITEHVD